MMKYRIQWIQIYSYNLCMQVIIKILRWVISQKNTLTLSGRGEQFYYSTVVLVFIMFVFLICLSNLIFQSSRINIQM